MAEPTFLLLEGDECRYETSRSAILPVPYERTTSWGKGAAEGPSALLEASGYVETWDEELAAEPSRAGIATLPPVVPTAADPALALAEIERSARAPIADGKFVVAVGGEHSITAPLVRATAAVHGDLGVLQFDAHADLRDEYEGTPHSHACVMRRIVDAGFATAAIGVRSLSAEEAKLIDRRRLPVLWGHELERLEELLPDLLARLPDRIYLTFDVDFLDPSLVPATGTPEPGGGLWYPTLAALRTVFAHKEVAAMDLVELAPRPEHPASAFLAAKLVYKCLGYRWRDAGDRGAPTP